MKITRQGVRELVKDEMKMANEEFPMFRSDHEGMGVIEEEVKELEEDFNALKEAFEDFQTSIFKDHGEDRKKVCASHITMIATEAACEAIQVAAMGYKFTESMILRKEQENDQ